MRHPDFNIQAVIDHLQGTCMNDVASAVEVLFPGMDEEDLIEEDHNEIDNQIFRCESCGWWCDAHDQDEEGNCTDCSTEEEDD